MKLESAKDILTKIKKTDYLDVLNELNEISPLDVEGLYADYCNGNQGMIELQKYWVESLGKDEPDYSVYDNPLYLNELFYCWKKYSREYIRLLDKWIDVEQVIDRDSVKSAIDFGCGIAFSTLGLKAIFPKAVVYGTNQSELQLTYDRKVTKDFNIEIVSDNFAIDGRIDVVFASEFFEHIQEPIAFLEKVLDQYKPRYIIFANTFGQMACGHFYKYLYNGEWIDGKSASRIFSKTLRMNGYKKIQTGFYNNRPNVYKYEGMMKTRRLF